MTELNSRIECETILHHRIVVLGDGGVGKSAITIQFFQSNFVEDHDPTIEDSYVKQCVVDDKWCKLDVLDTAGQDEFTTMREQYMRKGHGFVIVYSVIDRRTFESVPVFFKRICQTKDSTNVPVIIVANKVDLVDERKVTEQEGIELAKSLNALYVETSAKPPPKNISKVFFDIVIAIREKVAAPKKSKPKKNLPSCLTCFGLSSN